MAEAREKGGRYGNDDLCEWWTVRRRVRRGGVRAVAIPEGCCERAIRGRREWLLFSARCMGGHTSYVWGVFFLFLDVSGASVHCEAICGWGICAER